MNSTESEHEDIEESEDLGDQKLRDYITINIPLFLRKLWKMVNDSSAQDIIGWNSTGDGFIIYDQLQFMMTLLPKYFKHNNLSSFVRQLNFYDFHKVANIDKDEMHFTHNYFLKDLPQTLVFIKRKGPARPRATRDPDITDILNNIKDMKSKHELVNKELKRLQQENAALWTEMNSLRTKHSKQTKIINKLIHFLISYMQSQHHSVAKNRSGTKSQSNKRLKTGPTILELDYHKSPVEAWTEFDNLQDNTEQHHQNTVTDATQTEYTVTEPENNVELETGFPNLVSLDAITCSPVATTEIPQSTSPKPSSSKDISTEVDLPATSNKSTPTFPINFAESPKEHLGYYIDNTQVELNSIHEMLNNLSSNDMATFYELLNENRTDNELNTIKGDDDLQKQLNEICFPLQSPLSITSLEETVCPTKDDISTIEKQTDENMAKLTDSANVIKLTYPDNTEKPPDTNIDSLISEVDVDSYFNI